MALRVWRPTKPSMAPGLNPAAFSLPWSSRISSGVNGAELCSAVGGNCDADWGNSGVDLTSSFAVGGGAAGKGEVAGGETGGAEAAARGGAGGREATVRGEAGGAPTRGPAADGAGTDGRTVTSRLPAAGPSAFACSIRFNGNGVEA